MKLLIKLLASFYLLTAFIVNSGCASPSQIVGKWQSTTTDLNVEFTKDGSVVLNSNGTLIAGTYRLIGNEVVKLNLEGLAGQLAGGFSADTWQYNISGNTMNITVSGENYTLNRVDTFFQSNTLISTTPKTITTPPVTSWKSPPSMVIDTNKSYTATIKTNYGDIVIELLPKESPITVNNFIFLARQGFYDRVKFHRVVKGFVIQTGDPTGTGRGGPGYQFNDELPIQREYGPGIVAMANSGSNTNGSQFFICTGSKSKQLNYMPNYNIFGRVTSGMDVVLKIDAVPVTGSEPSSPTVDVYIINILIGEY